MVGDYIRPSPDSSRTMFAIPEPVLIAILRSMGGSIAISYDDIVDSDKRKYHIITEQHTETGNWTLSIQEKI